MYIYTYKYIVCIYAVYCSFVFLRAQQVRIVTDRTPRDMIPTTQSKACKSSLVTDLGHCATARHLLYTGHVRGQGNFNNTILRQIDGAFSKSRGGFGGFSGNR